MGTAPRARKGAVPEARANRPCARRADSLRLLPPLFATRQGCMRTLLSIWGKVSALDFSVRPL